MKTKPVSSSTGGGGVGGGKRSAQDDAPSPGRSSTDQPAPPKVAKIGFGLISQPVKKPNPISIKLGASVSIIWRECVDSGFLDPPI